MRVDRPLAVGAAPQQIKPGMRRVPASARGAGTGAKYATLRTIAAAGRAPAAPAHNGRADHARHVNLIVCSRTMGEAVAVQQLRKPGASTRHVPSMHGGRCPHA